MTKEIFTKQQLEAAIIEYNLTELVNTLPPQNYIARRKKTVRCSIEDLYKDLMLTPYLKAIPKRPGVRPNKGLPSKAATIEALYGLNRYYRELIEALDEKWVRKAIKYALKNNQNADPALVKRLKTENNVYYNNALKTKEKEIKKAQTVEKMLQNVIADESLSYAGTIIDLTQNDLPTDLSSITLPLNDAALVFIAAYPKNIIDAMKLINNLGLTYVDNIVWDRDAKMPTGDWSKNQHTNILVAIKGDQEKPANEFQLLSIYFEHKTQSLTSLPDYYFSMMEEMNPGKQYLEVFSCRQFSDKWHIFEINKEEKE